MTRSFAPALLLLLLLPGLSTAYDAAEDPYRLDPGIRPLSQTIDLTVDPRQSGYEGRVSIEIEVDAPTDSIRLHAREMELVTVELSRDGKTRAMEAKAGEAGLVTLRDGATIPAGRHRLDIAFTNDFDTRAHSLYRLDYEDGAYLFTQFEATDARGAFPCFDEPGWKIPWQMNLTVPSDDVAISNTPVVASTPLAEGSVRVEYATTPPLPSYLLAIAVGPFDLVDVEDMDVPTRVVCPRGKAPLATLAAEMTPPIVQALEDYFGRDYPYAKLDLIAVPEFWPGAMENPGAITYRDNLLLVDEAAATVAQRRRLASVHAHELAHQWFGNLVTMRWWDDLWLNESFASWLGDKITHEVYPEFGIAVTSVRSSEGAKGTDAQASTRAIRAPVYGDDNLETMDAAITYSKGQTVLGMFESFLGEERFREGVRHYIDANVEGNATAGDLFDALGEATGVEVRAAMSTFIDQPGVPNVRVNVLGDGKLEFVQSRFSNHGTDLQREKDWHIPIVFRWSDGEQVRTQRLLLDEPSKKVELPGGANPDWIHPNADERGYYRWELGADRLRALVENAEEILSLRERVALAGILSAQLDAGRLDGGSYLELTGGLCDDPAPEVIDAALSSMTRVRAAFVTSEIAPAFRAYVRATVGPILARYGVQPRPDEAEAVSLLRPDLIGWLGLWGDDSDVQALAEELARTYLEDRSAVDASLAGPSLRIAARNADWRLYNQYKTAFEEAEVPAERSRFLSAMGYFEDRAMQQAALHYALEGPTRPQELFTIPMGVGTMELEDEDLLWNWFTENYQAISDKIPDMFQAYLPYFAGGCSTDRLEVAREFFAEPEHTAPGQDRILEKVAEQSTDCAQLREREGPAVTAYLQRFERADR